MSAERGSKRAIVGLVMSSAAGRRGVEEVARGRALRRSWFLRLGLVALLLTAPAAHAEPSAADKETARALLLDGRAKMAAKDHAGALKSFEGAHAIMGVPTTGLDLARAQAALGRLIEAREAALAVTRMAVQAGESEAFADARKAAEELAAKIAPRIASVVVIVKGPEGAAASVTLDATALPPALLGLPRKVNPGRHTIEASAAGFATERREVELLEGQTQTVELSLAVVSAPVATGTATAVGAVAPSASSAAAPPSASPSAAVPPSGAPAWAWVAGGVGLVAAGVGVGVFADYLSVRDTLAKECPGDVCTRPGFSPEEANGLLRRWNVDLGLTVGLGVLALAGAGVAVFGFTSSPAAARARTGARVWVTPAGAGLALEGAF